VPFHGLRVHSRARPSAIESAGSRSLLFVVVVVGPVRAAFTKTVFHSATMSASPRGRSMATMATFFTASNHENGRKCRLRTFDVTYAWPVILIPSVAMALMSRDCLKSGSIRIVRDVHKSRSITGFGCPAAMIRTTVATNEQKCEGRLSASMTRFVPINTRACFVGGKDRRNVQRCLACHGTCARHCTYRPFRCVRRASSEIDCCISRRERRRFVEYYLPRNVSEFTRSASNPVANPGHCRPREVGRQTTRLISYSF